MSNLFIEIFQTNESKNYRVSDPQFLETRFSTKKCLYRSLLKEYGKCVSKQYVGGPNNKPQQIGWIFERREAYSELKLRKSFKHMNKFDRDMYSFICATWVSVHIAPPTKVITNHYAKF